MDRWVGKVAIVTGASSGIGEAICKTLVVAGLNVLGLARREDRLKQLAVSLKNAKGSFHYLRCDVRNENDILKAFAYAVKNLGSVDVLINNAGIVKNSTIADGKTDDFRAVMEVNVLGPTICTREALKCMRKQKTEGYIFNINSVAGLKPLTLPMPINLYPASKYALRAMTDTTKLEILQHKDNIRITGIHPGVVKTEILGSTGMESMVQDMPSLESEHIADIIVFALTMPLIVQMDEIAVTPLHQSLH